MHILLPVLSFDLHCHRFPLLCSRIAFLSVCTMQVASGSRDALRKWISKQCRHFCRHIQSKSQQWLWTTKRDTSSFTPFALHPHTSHLTLCSRIPGHAILSFIYFLLSYVFVFLFTLWRFYLHFVWQHVLRSIYLWSSRHTWGTDRVWTESGFHIVSVKIHRTCLFLLHFCWLPWFQKFITEMFYWVVSAAREIKHCITRDMNSSGGCWMLLGRPPWDTWRTAFCHRLWKQWQSSISFADKADIKTW